MTSRTSWPSVGATHLSALLTLVCALSASEALAKPDARGAQERAADTVEVARQSGRAQAAEQRAAAMEEALAEVKGEQPQESFEVFLARQASLEVQIALKLYATYDDYRAIGALRRYQAIANSPSANFLASLMIGQIYHRNSKHPQAAYNFEQAIAAAPSTTDRVWAYLMTVQQLCLPLSYYYECQNRLNEVLQVEQIDRKQRELIDYQRLYVDVVLRSPYVTPARAQMFSDEQLKLRALGLIKRDEAFYDLDLQRPWLAGTLSAVLPGAGQVYNGRYLDGGIAFGVNALFGAATYYAFVEADSIPLGVVSALFLSGFYIGNIVNAYTDAQRINAQTYLKFFEDLKVDYWPRVHFQINQSAVSFDYSFDWPGPKPGERAKPSKEEPSGEPAQAAPRQEPPQPRDQLL